METNLQTRLSRILIIIGEIILLGIILLISKSIICPFKLIFSIPCPFCGLTRSIKSLLTLNIKEAIYYNILTIPLLILQLIFIIEIVLNKKIITKKLIIPITIILLIISLFINIYHEI